MSKKLVFFCCYLVLTFGKVFAEEITFVTEVRGVMINGGTVYGAIYSNNNTYRNTQPDYTFQGNPINGILEFSLQIPAGEYVIQVYQDINNNGQLDFGWFNIPKEPVGITNFNGRGSPGNFNRHKVLINNNSRIVIQIHTI